MNRKATQMESAPVPLCPSGAAAAIAGARAAIQEAQELFQEWQAAGEPVPPL